MPTVCQLLLALAPMAQTAPGQSPAVLGRRQGGKRLSRKFVFGRKTSFGRLVSPVEEDEETERERMKRMYGFTRKSFNTEKEARAILMGSLE
ncbi:hypothetical protein EYF80_007224 [Liparis tanakae]|uniref:Uncharacterized protein n=1 Tax=Liparis tanakae TaxID=230148 RepID=A0A4Z2IWM1_9TELE|nr:hypothetical protein EYF80_007224 [Liparis tanakae]